MDYEKALRAAESLKDKLGLESPELVIVLGSGLGSVLDAVEVTASCDFGDISEFPQPSSTGHSGKVYGGNINGRECIVYAGRKHAYEGVDLDAVVRPLRAAILLGAKKVVLTNACGGISPGMGPGTLALVKDHLNLAGRDPLVGLNDERLGPRFPNLVDLYTPRLRELAHRMAKEHGTELPEVNYAWWLGPSFETPAEIDMIGRLGADVVGMSTVPEAIAARHMGADVVVFSLISNYAAGLFDSQPTAEEVIDVANEALPRIVPIIKDFIAADELFQ